MTEVTLEGIVMAAELSFCVVAFIVIVLDKMFNYKGEIL